MMLLFEYAYKVCNFFACRTIEGIMTTPLDEFSSPKNNQVNI